MRLKSIKYFRTYQGDTWSIRSGVDNQPLVLNDINLVVGQNASGKTNTIQTLLMLSDLLAGRTDIKQLPYDTAEYDVVFENGEDSIHYIMAYNKAIVTKEVLTINDIVLVDREKGEMFYESVKDMLAAKTEDYQLLAARRDSLQHSYLDQLFYWGQLMSFYDFGDKMGKNIGVKDTKQIIDGKVDYRRGVDAITSLIKGRSDINEFIENIVNDFNKLGYNISSVDLQKVKREGIPGSVLSVQENGLHNYTDQLEMSDGMFRALSLIIQMEYSLASELPSCILIDDIGEGLDYERSLSLIKLIKERAENSNLQVFMTTNDRFVMNAIDIVYWQVVGRDANGIKFYNYSNSKETFDLFKMMGLNNFEFFQSKYYKGIALDRTEL